MQRLYFKLQNQQELYLFRNVSTILTSYLLGHIHFVYLFSYTLYLQYRVCRMRPCFDIENQLAKLSSGESSQRMMTERQKLSPRLGWPRPSSGQIIIKLNLSNHLPSPLLFVFIKQIKVECPPTSSNTARPEQKYQLLTG